MEKSLWGITNDLKEEKRLYHLDMKQTAKATFARINAEQRVSL